MKKLFVALFIAIVTLTGCDVSNHVTTMNNESEEERLYSSEDPEECKKILFACVSGRKTFFDETGCGCELIKPTLIPNAVENDIAGSETMESDLPEPFQVVIGEFQYTPFSLHVEAGTTVTWVNNADDPHTITSTNLEQRILNSSDLKKGDTYSYTFDTPGTYEYFCAIHPAMKGSVTVSE